MKIRAFVVLCLSFGLLAGCQGPQRVAGPYEGYCPASQAAATQDYQSATPNGAVGAGYGYGKRVAIAQTPGYSPMYVNANSPAVAGPGPGVIPGQRYGAQGMGPVQTSQVSFIGPAGARIQWDISAVGAFDSPELVCPGRENFPQNGIYRLKLSHIPGREGVELYPTLEIAPVTPRTVEFLTHQAISVSFTDEDITQVLSGNFVTKVIYLPDPEFQELAIAVGTPDTLVSTRLDPGVDPITEAARRGSIMAIVRLGNIDIQKGNIDAQGYGQPVSIGSPYMSAAGSGNPNYYVSGVSGPAYGQPSRMTPSGVPSPARLPSAYTGDRTEYNNIINTYDPTHP